MRDYVGVHLQELRAFFTVMQSIENCNVSLSEYAVAVGEDTEISVTCEQGQSHCPVLCLLWVC